MWPAMVDGVIGQQVDRRVCLHRGRPQLWTCLTCWLYVSCSILMCVCMVCMHAARDLAVRSMWDGVESGPRTLVVPRVRHDAGGSGKLATGRLLVF